MSTAWARPNSRNVSRTLKEAGHMPVNGTVMYKKAGGFRSAQDGDKVHVTYRAGADSDHLSTEELAQLKGELLAEWLEILQSAGYEAEISHGSVYVMCGILRKGVAVKPSSSQEAEMTRFDTVLVNKATGEKVHSFTWAKTAEDASKRISQSMEDDPAAWGGWGFSLSV